MKELQNFCPFLVLRSMNGNMFSQQIKIYELLDLIEKDNSYVMPNKNTIYKKSSIKDFLTYSNSTYSAAKILFDKKDYSFNINYYPKETAKFANTFITFDTSKYNFSIPQDFSIDILSNTILQKYFPIEWIIRNILINENNLVIVYNKSSNSYSLEKYVDSGKYQTCLSKNISAIETAFKTNSLNQIYFIYLNNYLCKLKQLP